MTQLARLDEARQVALELADSDPARFGLLVAALELPLDVDRAVDELAALVRARAGAASLDALLPLARPARRRGRRGSL